MKKLILDLLNILPWHSAFGMGVGDELKIIYYQKIGHKNGKCLCGGKVYTRGIPPDGWETSCYECEFLYDED